MERVVVIGVPRRAQTRAQQDGGAPAPSQTQSDPQLPGRPTFLPPRSRRTDSLTRQLSSLSSLSQPKLPLCCLPWVGSDLKQQKPLWPIKEAPHMCVHVCVHVCAHTFLMTIAAPGNTERTGLQSVGRDVHWYSF